MQMNILTLQQGFFKGCFLCAHKNSHSCQAAQLMPCEPLDAELVESLPEIKVPSDQMSGVMGCKICIILMNIMPFHNSNYHLLSIAHVLRMLFLKYFYFFLFLQITL